MPRMTSDFLEHVPQHPSQVHDLAPTDLYAFSIQISRRIEHGIGMLSSQLVPLKRNADRTPFVIGGHKLLPCKAMQEPIFFDKRQMIHQPQQRGV